MPQIENRVASDVAACEHALITKAAGQNVTFVQVVSTRHSVSTKELQTLSGPPKVDFDAVRAAMRAGDHSQVRALAFGGTTVDLCAEVGSLHAALGNGEVDGTLVVELSADGDRSRLEHSFELDEISPAKVVLDADLGAGATEAEILAAETTMGLRLPEDLRALYCAVHSDTGESGLLGAQALFPLQHIVAVYLEGEPGTSVESGDLFPVTPVL